MAKNTTDEAYDRLTHPLFDELGPISAAVEGLFAYSAKIVCGKQTDASCCCSAGVRPWRVCDRGQHSKSQFGDRASFEVRSAIDQFRGRRGA